MKNFTKIGFYFLIPLLMLISPSAQASHLKGGDTYFICLGNGQYELVFYCYYACEPTSIGYDDIPTDFSWSVTSSCGTVPTTITAATATPAMDVPLYCPGVLTQCDYYDSTLEATTGEPYANAPPTAPVGTLVIVYTSAPFSIPPGCTVSATMDFSARNAAISNLVNPGSYDINIEATVTAPANGSSNNNPQFAQYPVNVFCVGQNANFSQGAIDLNGDSLTYTLINPQTAGGVAIPFVPGCTPTDPLGVNGGTGFASSFNFNNATGNINFTPTATGDYVLTVQVDAFHNGVLVGSTMRDIQFNVVNCNASSAPPTLTNSGFTTTNVIGGTVIDSTHIGVCPGATVQINLASIDTASFSYIIDSTNVGVALPGSTYYVTHSGTRYDTSVLHITWTAQASDSGFHYFLVTVRDTSCPTPGRNTYAFVVSVLSGLDAGPNLVYCQGGSPVTIYATGANHYLWSDSATGGPPVGVISYGPDSSYIVVAPSSIPINSSVGYVVQGDLLGSCKNRDTVSVKNALAFTLHTTTQDTSVCKYATTVLTTTPTPGNLAPFTYSWSPPGAVVSPTSASTATAPLLGSTYYHVTVTSAAGCAIRDSVRVDVNGAAPRISILPSTNYVCPGDTVLLNSLILSENLVPCGIVDTLPSNPIYFAGNVNNDTSSSTGSAGFTNVYGSPFMGSINSFKVQYLFTQAELNAAGLSSGTITDIAFYIKALNSTVSYDSFSVSMGCTTDSTLTGFESGLQDVVPTLYGANAPTANTNLFANSWNPIPFNNYFNWDGSSNLVIQICYTFNSALVSQDDFVSYSTTSNPGSCVYAGDVFGANGCTLGAGSFYYGVINTRPNIRFDMVAPDVLSYQWSPSTLICDTCPSTAFVVTRDTTVTLTVSDGRCVNDSTKRLLINPALAITALPDTTLCSGSDTVMLSVVLNNPSIPQCIQGYSVASIPYSTIAGTATSISPVDYIDDTGFPENTDNGTAGPLAIGFNFPFYCQSYSQFYANTNGWISFVDPYPATQLTQEYTAQTLPPSAADLNPQKVIELMMGDYYLADLFGTGGTGAISYFTTGTAPNRILVVQFTDMGDVTLTYTTSGEMHLYEGTGVIDILLTSSNYAGTNHTTGVKDSTGLGIAAPGRNNQPYIITTPEAWRFTPQFGPSATVAGSVWSPNVYLSNDSISNPLAYPPFVAQTYDVTTTVILNPTTHPRACVVTDSVRINFGHTSGSTASIAPGSICPGDTAHITFSSADTILSYSWRPALGLSDSTIADPTASPLDTIQYFVRAVNSEGCALWDSVTLDVLHRPTVTLPLIAPMCNCDPDSVITPVITGGAPGYTYAWSNSGTGATTVDTIINVSYYTLTVTDANHCSAVSNTDTIVMNCPKVSILVSPVSDTIFLRDTARLTAVTVTGSNFAYVWTSDSSTILSPSLDSTGIVSRAGGLDTVFLTVTDQSTGCTYSTIQVINVIEFGNFVMASAFTPNGDGRNDYFYPVINGPNSPVKVSAFRIYNRWGQLVYDNPNPPGWNGDFGGKEQPLGTYLYFVTVEYPDPNNAAKTVQKSVEGSFQLLR